MLVEIIRIARAAGALIEDFRRQGFQTRDKPDRSPVTEADLAADRLIGGALQAAFPGEPIVSEESRDVPGTGDATWVVDPLDGTEAFVDPQVRGYAVQIARVVGGRAVLGVVYEAAVGELFYAEAGEGAWLVTGDGAPERVRASRGRGSEGAPPRLVTSSRVPRGFREALFSHGLVDGGLFRSVGVKVGRIARGLAEVYPATHGLSVWDIAAPIAILEEAGGLMTDLAERAPHLSCAPDARDYPEPLVATNGPEHARWCEILRALYTNRRR